MSSQLPKEDVKVIMGDWNAKVGDKNTGSEEVMEKYSYGNKNWRCELLIEKAAKQKWKKYETDKNFQTQH